MAAGTEKISVAVSWPSDASRSLVTFVNVFNVQGTPDGIMVTLGQVGTPLFSGDARAQQAALANLASLDATVLGRFVLTQARAAELIGALEGALLSEIGAPGGSAGGPEDSEGAE